MKSYFMGGGELTGWSARLEQDKNYVTSIKKINNLPIEPVRGIDVWTEIWFSNDVLNVNHAFIDINLMEGDIGPKTNGMGSVVFLGNMESRLFREGIGRLVPILAGLKYHGLLSLHTTINKTAMCCHEIVARPNFNTIHALLELVDGRTTNILQTLKDGKIKTLKTKGELAVEVKMSIPPFPYNSEGVMSNIVGVNKKNAKHIWLTNVYKEGAKYVYRGKNGMVGAVSARGDNVDGWPPIRDAKRRVLRTIRNLKVSELMYRRDIGDRYVADIAKLKEWGWV